MRYLYYAILCGVAIFFVYFVGVHVGKIKCDSRIANMNTKQIVVNTKLSEDINETTLHTGTGDIRRILREKYTIAEQHLFGDCVSKNIWS